MGGNKMKTGPLLEALIDLAQIQKTDFAISMNMTPSGLSKILTGKRLPFFKEKRAFSRQAAAYFTEALFCPGCFLKFRDIFPVIYDFSSKYELETFLSYAVDYALSSDFFEENGGNRDYPDRELSFLGKTAVLSMFCVIVSDYILSDPEPSLEFYGTLPMAAPAYSGIFDRIRLPASRCERRISLHYFFNMSSFEASSNGIGSRILSCLSRMEQYADLNLWETEETIQPSFFLLKGHFLLIFSDQMDGRTPLMTFITHKSYLTIFSHVLAKKNTRKLSYHKDEAMELLEADPSLVLRLAGGRFDAVYSFLPMGYLCSPEEIAQMDGRESVKESVKENIRELLRCTLEKSNAVFISAGALSDFYATGRVIMPLIGMAEVAKEQRVSYLMRYDTAIDKKALHDKVRIANGELPKMFALCAENFGLIYLIDDVCGCEKIHIFHSDVIREILADEAADGSMMLTECGHELWNTYMGGLSKGQMWI